jgi:hypothetical protein
MVDFIIRIRVKERLSEEWSDWLDGLSITLNEDGKTILMGTVPDQSALRGILGKLWTNLTVLSFSLVDSTYKEKLMNEKINQFKSCLHRSPF